MAMLNHRLGYPLKKKWLPLGNQSFINLKSKYHEKL